jgi:endonuclease/exonuclease/phosphatase family metal-dependent hydrolase
MHPAPCHQAAAQQRDQNRALLRWAMRHLAGNPNANVVILGDFNEGKPPGSADQALAVLFQARPPMVDAFDRLTGRLATHANGRAYDRILISDAVVGGLAGLRLDEVIIGRHRHGRWNPSGNRLRPARRNREPAENLEPG